MVLLAQTASPAERVAGGANGDEKGEEDDNAADLVQGSISGKIRKIIEAWTVAMMIGGTVVVPL